MATDISTRVRIILSDLAIIRKELDRMHPPLNQAARRITLVLEVAQLDAERLLLAAEDLERQVIS